VAARISSPHGVLNTMKPVGGSCVRIAFAMVLLAAFAGDAMTQISPAVDGQDPEPYKISVNVDLVVLHATVRNSKGGFVSGLRERDFAVYEDGVRQSIRSFQHEDVPVTVGLIIDHSGSMGPKLPEVIAAARTFVHTSNPEDRLFVVNFNEKVTLGLPDSVSFTNRAEELERAISRMPAAGMTALYDATVEGLERFQAGSRDKGALIIVSDGGDNASKHTLAQLVNMAEQSSVVMYTIGIFDEADADRNPDVLRRLARTTGGEAFFPGQLDEVVAICERIARDIRNQYTVGYVSGNKGKPGVFRKIRVTASGTDGKLMVRARSGYIAGGEPGSAGHEAAK
jgi:Ca-activated chloride channel family protein